MLAGARGGVENSVGVGFVTPVGVYHERGSDTGFEHEAGIELNDDVTPIEHKADSECTPCGGTRVKRTTQCSNASMRTDRKKGAGHRGRTKSDRRNAGFEKTLLCNMR